MSGSMYAGMLKLSGFEQIKLLSGLVMVSLLLSCSTEDSDPKPIKIDLDLSPFNQLQVENSWILHPEEDILLLNVNDQIRAFSSVCPYRECTRDWLYRPGVWICDCCASKFDSFGLYLSGPAVENMVELTVVQENNLLFVG